MLHPLRAFEVTVHGLYFEPGSTPPTYTLKSLSGDTADSVSAYSDANWIQIPPFDEYDDDGNLVKHWEIVSGTEFTVFAFNLSGDWAGRQVCLSRDGGQTNYVHFYFGGLGFAESDFSGSPSAPAPSVTMLGNYFTIGRLLNGATEEYPPYVIGTSSHGNPAWPDIAIDFVATRSRSTWRWSNVVSSTDPRTETAMVLDPEHRLKLLGRGITLNAIVLDTVLGRITINDQPVLTASGAAAQFVSKTVAGVNLTSSGGTMRTQAGYPPQLVLGKFNDNLTQAADGYDHTQGVLIVGAGAPATANTPVVRKNGLRILDDGTVLILPKGDINMQFTAGERP